MTLIIIEYVLIYISDGRLKQKRRSGMHLSHHWVLRSAAELNLSLSAWFPKISDLRSAALEICRTYCADEFSDLPPISVDHLTYQAHELEESFYKEGRLDPSEWHSLADQFTITDHTHRSTDTLVKLLRLQSIQFTQSRIADTTQRVNFLSIPPP